MDDTGIGWLGVPLAIFAGAIRVSTPFLFVSLGECLTEKSGRINLGLEGTLIMGAMSGYGVSYLTGSPWLGVLVAGPLPLEADPVTTSLPEAFARNPAQTNSVSPTLSLSKMKKATPARSPVHRNKRLPSSRDALPVGRLASTPACVPPARSNWMDIVALNPKSVIRVIC